MEMTEEEYKRRHAEEMFPQAYQLGEIDKNKGIIEEKQKDRAIQKKKMTIAAISLVVAALSPYPLLHQEFSVKAVSKNG